MLLASRRDCTRLERHPRVVDNEVRLGNVRERCDLKRVESLLIAGCLVTLFLTVCEAPFYN